jgi:sugar O-acyltransferase, sialic acid O-acetyltransferase NeuD family
MESILIIGAGGVGKETALLIEQINHIRPTWNMLGFIDDNSIVHNTYINGYKVLGGIDYLKSVENIYVVCAITNYSAKCKIIDKLSSFNIKWAKIIHPSVYISPTNSVGEDVIIYPGVIITTNSNIGSHVILSPGCGIGHETTIEDFCSILWNVNVAGNSKIGRGCMLGSGATVIQNISVGSNSIIGAGAVVIRDIPENCVAAGVPAMVIKKSEIA